MNTVTTGMINGKRNRGRPREVMQDGVKQWHGGIPPIELIQNTMDLNLWISISFGRAHNDDDQHRSDSAYTVTTSLSKEHYFKGT